MKIIVDAMGGDNAPLEIVKGAIMAAEEFGVELLLVGKGESILRALDEMGLKGLPAGVEIANASEVVEMEDDPATVTKIKGDSSMTVGLKLLHEGKADAMVSAGSTGALLSGATLIVKRIRGIRRAAMAPLVPSSNEGFLLVDCGANVECTPEYLLQFAYMGHFYMKELVGRENPKVGLLNIGTEETKGTVLQKETWNLLKKASNDGRINFVGNVEARGAMLGDCDVLVTDGFSGNVLLKGLEGVSIFAMGEIKKIFMKNTKTKLAAVAIKDDLKEFKKRFDSSEVGGTMLLGISKPVIKAHGSSDAYAIRSAVKQAMNVVNADICGFIERNVEHMKIAAPTE